MILTIDRLALRVGGISEADGRRLAQLVGDGLAAVRLPATAAAAGAMHLTLDPQPGEALESMAGRIVRAMLGGLARTL